MKSGSQSVRNIGVGGMSLAILAAVGTFVVAPTTEVFAVTVADSGVISHNAEVVYGRVTDKADHPLAKVAITISAKTAKGLKVKATAHTGHDGTYKLVEHLKPGKYTVTVAEKVGKKSIHRSTSVTLRNGHAVKVNAKLVRSGIFSFLPVSTY